MTLLGRAWVGLGFLLLATPSAHAGTLTNATWFQVTEGVSLTRTFGQLSASGSSTAGQITVALSYPQTSVAGHVPKTKNGLPLLDLWVTVAQGGAQAITATAAMASGTPGVPGTLRVFAATHVGMGVNASMYVPFGSALIQVPLAVGKASTFMGTFTISGAFHSYTVDFLAWTPGTHVFTGLTTLGSPLPSVVAMGSFGLTANGGGQVTLVAPSRVSIDGALYQRNTASFTKLSMSFVPEPGTLLLLGGLALVLWGRRRPR